MIKKVYRLGPYQENAGILECIEYQGEALLARIGKLDLMLPIEMDVQLKPLIGQRIAILRTDLPDRPYLLRVLQSNRVETRQIMSPSTQTCEAFI